MLIPVHFQNHLRLTLQGVIHRPKNYTPQSTAIIFLHGFPGTMDGTAARFLNLFCRLGFLCLRFNFSGTATSAGKFADKRMSQEVKDIRYAIDFLQQHFPCRRIILVGISTGAIDAALYAPMDKRVDKLILLSGVSDLKKAVRYDFNDVQVRDFWKKGFITYHRPGHWVHHKRLKKAFYDEFFTLDIPKALKQWKKPLLIIHGSKDEAVPVQEAYQLYQQAGQPKKLCIIRGADHRFTGKWHQVQVVWQIWRYIA